MGQLKLIGLFFLVGQSFLSIGQTQTEMNIESGDKLKEAETELTATLSKIQDLYKSDSEFLKNLKESQDIWVKFRNAELKMKFPEREQGYYGSVQPMCSGYYFRDLTLERIKTLKTWVTGIEEGDACSGSVRRKE